MPTPSSAVPLVGGRPWSRLRSLVLFVAPATLGLLVSTPARSVGPQDRRLTNVRTGISVEAPAGWTLSQHIGYGDTIVLLLHPDGSRISVTAATTTARDAAGLLEQNRLGLVAQGLTPSPVGRGPRGSLAIDLTRSGQGDKVRQLYLVRDIPGGRQAVVLTAICRADSFTAHSSALDFVATRLVLDDPAAPAGLTRTDHPFSGTGGRNVRGSHGGQGGKSGSDADGGQGDQGGQTSQSDHRRSGGQAHAAD